MAPLGGGTVPVQDHVALAEIELCGELIIAASNAEERLVGDHPGRLVRWHSQDELKVLAVAECMFKGHRASNPGLPTGAICRRLERGGGNRHAIDVDDGAAPAFST